MYSPVAHQVVDGHPHGVDPVLELFNHVFLIAPSIGQPHDFRGRKIFSGGNKADAKNRESENPEEISLPSGRTPPRLCSNTGGALRNREPEERGGGGPSVCEYGRNDKTPKGLPHGSCVKEKAARVGGRRCGSPSDPIFRTILCSSGVTCCIKRIYRNCARTEEPETMSRRQDRFPFFQSYQPFLPHWDRLPNCTLFLTTHRHARERNPFLQFPERLATPPLKLLPIPALLCPLPSHPLPPVPPCRARDPILNPFPLPPLVLLDPLRKFQLAPVQPRRLPLAGSTPNCR